MAAQRCAALLRGVNVGTAKRIAMADLRAAVTRAGFTDVRTLLNSGNVVFTTTGTPAAAGAAIEAAITKQFGIVSRVTVVRAATLDAVIAENPLRGQEVNPSRMMVGFPASPKAAAKVAPLLDRDWGDEELAAGPHAIYYWFPNGSIDSPLATAVAKAFRDDLTTRNWATVLKLQALLRAD